MTSLAAMMDDLRRRGEVSADEVRQLRGLVFGADIEISPQEAEALIELDEGVDAPGPEWRAFFVEGLTDFVVRQQQPSGYVDEAKARWLLDHVARDGTVKTATELEALVYILEQADSAPAFLPAKVIDQVRLAVVADGSGVTAEEVAVIRRVVFAIGGDGGLSISTAEAEALFALNDAARGRDNDPAWTDLFAKAVGGAILNAASYQAPPAAEALRRQAWLEERPKLGSTLGQAFSFGRRKTAPTPDSWDLLERRNDALDATLDQTERVTQDEARRLLDLIGRDGEFDDNERALLRFLKAEAIDVHPALKPLLDKAA